MNATIIDKSRNDWGTYYSIMVGTQETRVTIYNDGRVNVCVMNAAARTWRMAAGKVWNDVNEALGGYKSEKTLAAIRTADSDCGPQNAEPFSLFDTMGSIFNPKP